jgi:hypothetical protein
MRGMVIWPKLGGLAPPYVGKLNTVTAIAQPSLVRNPSTVAPVLENRNIVGLDGSAA